MPTPCRLALSAALSLATAAAATAQAPATTPGPGAGRAVGWYDPAAQRVRLIAGPEQLRTRQRDRVWEWDGARWRLVTDSGPPARGNAAAAHDARRRLTVLTGGARRTANDSAYEIVADTWTGDAGGWRPMPGTDVGARDHHALVFDEARGVVTLFGGIPGDRPPRWPTDTWVLRPSGWSRVATEGPTGRGRTALVYDRARRHVVLFGGVGEDRGGGRGQPFYDDTWTWDGARWRRVADGGPPARYAHGMVYDERAGVVLLYSGSAAHSGAPLADMWQWDGRRWTEIALSGPTPGHRYQPTMVYDRARGRTVLHGGLGRSTDDTWEWDGRQWREVRP